MLHTYRDSDDQPVYFDPVLCEVHCESFRQSFRPFYEDSSCVAFIGDPDLIVARIPQGAWIQGEVFGLIRDANTDSPLWERYRFRWRQISLGEVVDYFDSRSLDHPDSLVADIEASQRGSLEPTQPSPIVCHQADVANFLGRSPNTAHLLQTLQHDKVLRFEPPLKRGQKAKVWFLDPNQHEQARQKLSGKPSRRSAKRRKP
jgi:hypothetical protein